VEEITKAVVKAENEGEARQTVALVLSPALAVPATLHASLMRGLTGSARPELQLAGQQQNTGIMLTAGTTCLRTNTARDFLANYRIRRSISDARFAPD
jgi:hypothetical protein